MRAIQVLALVAVGVPSAQLAIPRLASACTWSKQYYTSGTTHPIDQDYQPWVGATSTASCTTTYGTYTPGPGGGLDPAAATDGNPTFAPWFDNTTGELFIYAIGLNGGTDREILVYDSALRTNGCSGWDSLDTKWGQTNMKAYGLSGNGGLNILAWQQGLGTSGHHFLWRKASTTNWVDLTAGSYLHGTGTWTGDANLIGQGGAIVDSYGIGTTKVIPLLDRSGSSNYCSISTSGPPLGSLCVGLYDETASPADELWHATTASMCNPATQACNAGAIQLEGDRVTVPGLYALSSSSYYIYNWASGSPGSWSSVVTTFAVCGQPPTVGFVPGMISVKSGNIYALQSSDVCGYSSCPVRVAQYNSTSVCWDDLAPPVAMASIVADNSTTYGPSLWASDSTWLYACY